MKKGLKIAVTLMLAGVLILGGAVYTIFAGKSSNSISLMKETFAEEVLQYGNPQNGIHFKLIGPGVVEEVLKRLNLSETELKAYFDQGKTLLDYALDKGISKEKLIQTFKDVITEKLNELLNEGKITETQKQEVLSDIDSRIEDFITKTPPFKNGKGNGQFPPVEPPRGNENLPPFMPPRGQIDEKDVLMEGLMEEVLNKLNLTVEDFQNARKEGKSLLEFVESKGITKDNLVSVVKEIVTEKLNQLLKDGKITEDQKARFLEKLDDFVERFINGKGFGRGRGPHNFNGNGECYVSPSSSSL